MKSEVTPLDKPAVGDVFLPGSKSIVNRVLLMAAMAKGKTRLSNLLFSDDTEAMIAGLESLGVTFELERDAATIEIDGCDGIFPNQNADVFCRESGTMTRFIIPMLAAQPSGTFHVDGSERMRARPLAGCLKGLEAFGAEIEFHETPYAMPLTIHAKGLHGGEFQPPMSESTQILSGLAMAAPYFCRTELSQGHHPDDASQELRHPDDAKRPSGPIRTALKAKNLNQKPYIQMSLRLMEIFGASVTSDSDGVIIQQGGYTGRDYVIEPDLSTSSYFFAAAALTQGRVSVHHIPGNPLQGDIRFLEVLAQVGCDVSRQGNVVTVQGPRKLKGISVNMRNFSDTFMTLSAMACFADGPTTITDIAHTRLQESDRIEAIATGLRILGAKVETFEDGLTITPSQMHGGEVSGFNDHRIAMSLGLVGLMIPGVVIDGADCVKKTCPDYFERVNRFGI